MAGGRCSPFLEARLQSPLLPSMTRHQVRRLHCELMENGRETVSSWRQIPELCYLYRWARAIQRIDDSHPWPGGCKNDLDIVWEWQGRGKNDIWTTLPSPPASLHPEMFIFRGWKSQSSHLVRPWTNAVTWEHRVGVTDSVCGRGRTVQRQGLGVGS